MIESLINPDTVERRPWEAFLAGFLFTITACFLTQQIGVTGTGAGLLVVSFISIAAAPFMLRIFEIEEKKCELHVNAFNRHSEVVSVFAFFFISVIFASSLFFVLSNGTASETMFSDQTKDLCSKGIITDPYCAKMCGTGEMKSDFCASQLSGDATAFNPDFMTILINNLTVLFLAIVFSLALGAGAVYLITWNATILGVLIAKIAEHPTLYGSVDMGDIILNYIVALPMTLIRLLPHGLFEFGGYFFGAVAGGLMSMCIVKNYRCYTSNGKRISLVSFKDAVIYGIIAVLLIVIGAAVEVML